MTELNIEIGTGTVIPVPVPVTSVDVPIASGQCKLYGWSLRDAAADATKQGEASVTSPGAAATVISIGPFAAGIYDVTWTVALQGTPAAIDANNFLLQNNTVTVEGSINPGAVGVYPQVGVRIPIAAGNFVKIIANGAGTAGAVYLAQLEVAVTLVANAVGELQDGGNILGEVAMPAGEATTEWFDEPALSVQSQIKLHVISGIITGTVFVKFLDA
jgi:hypothetical protein